MSLCAIADELKLSYLKTIYCNQLTVDGAEYIRKRMNRSELSLNELQPPLNSLDIYRLALFQSGTVPVRKRQIANTGDVDEPPKRRRRRKANTSKQSASAEALVKMSRVVKKPNPFLNLS